MWFAKITGDNVIDDAISITTDSTGHAYVLGHVDDTATFDPSASLSLQTTDYYVAQLDALGQFKWATPIGGTPDKELVDLAFYDGKLYVAGSFWTPAIFVGSGWLTPNSASTDVLLLRADPQNQGQLDFATFAGGMIAAVPIFSFIPMTGT